MGLNYAIPWIHSYNSKGNWFKSSCWTAIVVSTSFLLSFVHWNWCRTGQVVMSPTSFKTYRGQHWNHDELASERFPPQPVPLFSWKRHMEYSSGKVILPFVLIFCIWVLCMSCSQSLCSACSFDYEEPTCCDNKKRYVDLSHKYWFRHWMHRMPLIYWSARNRWL